MHSEEFKQRVFSSMSRKKRKLASKLTGVLLLFSFLINAYLLFSAPVKNVKIKNVVNLNEKNSEFLSHKSQEHEKQLRQNKDKLLDQDVLANIGKENVAVVEGKGVEKQEKENKEKAQIKEKGVQNDKDKNMVCSEFSLWTEHLVKPQQPTDIKNWSFKKKKKCPKFTVDKYPPVRQKISLHCNGPFSKLVTSTTTSTRDITSVEFGNLCLSEVIDNCCKGKQAVPNVVHYIWYADKDLGYFQFISFMSALRFMKPCLFLIHGMYIPRGKYWNYFVSISPNIIHVVREKPTIVFGQKLAYEEHASDIMRIEALKMYGGVYLDFDEIVLRPLEPLRKYEYTQGHERDVTMGSQLVMAKKNATFLNHWYKSYRDDYQKSWAWNALWVPDKLSKQYPNLIHVEGYNFTRPNWQHVDLIFKTNYDWSTNYGMHMYIRWYKNETNNVIIRTLNTTIGAVCRHVLFGNKELCIS